MLEVYTDIQGYEGLYKISNLGNVLTMGAGKSNYSSCEKILKPFYRGLYKYAAVRLYKDGVAKDWSVHRLVALHFLDNPHNYPSVNHKNKNRLDNRVENLEWCTHQYNKEHGSSKNYELLSPDGELIKIFNLSKFCREHNLSNGSLYSVLSGKYSHHKGWKLP